MNAKKASLLKDQGESSVWKKNNIAALEYCDLHRAAELLNCRVDDLLHWAEIGAIELCLKFSGLKASLKHIELSSKYRRNPAEWIRNRLTTGYFDKYLATKNNQLSGLMPIIGPEPKINDDGTFEQEFYFEKPLPALICHIFGVWGLITFRHDNFFASLKSSGKTQVTGLNLHLKPADEDLTMDSIRLQPSSELFDEFDGLMQPAQTLFTITPSDLFITRKQIEKIFIHDGKVIPNYINGGVDSPQEIAPSAVSEEINLNKNMLGGLIDMLICSVPELGQDVANASTNKKRDLLEAFLAEKQKLNHLVDYSIPGYDTFSKYFKN
ncbi:hypothetical protein FFB58_10510 [Enterobacter sp. MF024]|uniref:hypothetical protein n=1 Tax=Enterobacter sp. MF024 TaxID=2555644 RepID=UPI0011062D4D|nr:hypothetical protein [Enterobacter sp. MF024]TLU68313.1 hypothetical protein FFB58_10510 [Enterobacter sp. MF024]